MSFQDYEVQKVWILNDDLSFAIAYEEDTSVLKLFKINWSTREYAVKQMNYIDASWSLTSSGIESAKFFGTSEADVHFYASISANIDSTIYLTTTGQSEG